jgi:hypothetical protein
MTLIEYLEFGLKKIIAFNQEKPEKVFVRLWGFVNLQPIFRYFRFN